MEAYLAILGATVVDVAANGQCGWIAYYATTHNSDEGLMKPSQAVTKAANTLKKKVLNSMIANLAREASVDKATLIAEMKASGCSKMTDGDLTLALCDLANHYVDQRQRSVKSTVPVEYWVRQTHLKAMALNGREPIFVMCVRDDGPARMQVYTYEDRLLDNGDTFEMGKVTTVPTKQAIGLLQELVGAGILPRMMVLRWQRTGNHFQAVHYPEERYARYAEQDMLLALKRNEIMRQRGFGNLDTVPTAPPRSALGELKTLRKAAKNRLQLNSNTETLWTDEEDEDEGLGTEKELVDKEELAEAVSNPKTAQDLDQEDQDEPMSQERRNQDQSAQRDFAEPVEPIATVQQRQEQLPESAEGVLIQHENTNVQQKQQAERQEDVMAIAASPTSSTPNVK